MANVNALCFFSSSFVPAQPENETCVKCDVEASCMNHCCLLLLRAVQHYV